MVHCAELVAHAAEVPLVRLAAAKFPNLTHAERAMLAFADAGNVERGEIAVAGSSADPADQSNDPKRADQWSHERDIRAALIMWLCDDPAATPLINRAGLSILGARIVGGLDLSNVRVPFALAMRQCSIAERMTLIGTEIPHLNLNGSYVIEIDAKGLIVHGDLDLANGFHASGETRIETARIDGALNCSGGYFHYSKVSLSQYAGTLRPAVILDDSTIGSDLDLTFGFRSEGAVLMRHVSVANDFDMFGARISNPHNTALRSAFSSFRSVWIGSPPIQRWGNFEADGRVDFTAAATKTGFLVSDARFLGAPGDGHGFFAPGMTSAFFLWRNVQLQNGATVDLGGAHVGGLLDEEKSWPEPGNLLIDGLTYDGFGAGSPLDVQSRLRWISLQPPVPGGFEPQPYRQLAKVYRESGLDSEAVQMLIAEADARYSRYGLVGRLWGSFLRTTVGYGHRPLRAILWSFAVIVLGWLMVRVAKRAGVMRPTWPENAPVAQSGDDYERLYPFLYSLDVFLPFVNLHQEQYWWPKAAAKGQCRVFGYRLTLPGTIVLYYLWLQIIAGWLLSAIFVAGVTGLMRND